MTHILQKHLHADFEASPASPADDDEDNSNDEKPPGAGAPKSLVPLHQYNAMVYTTLNRTLNAIFIILPACAAIVSLNVVPDTNKRVGMVCAFSLVCAVGMALGSGASRIEIFAVSAA